MKKIIFLICLTFPSLAYSGEGYICIPDKATGFSFDKEIGWKLANFIPNDKFVIIRPNKSDKERFKHLNNLAWVIKKLGDTGIEAPCEEASPINDMFTGATVCEGLSTFKINFKNLRFLHAHLWGFYSDKLDSDNTAPFYEGKLTPYIEIGKCSPL